MKPMKFFIAFMFFYIHAIAQTPGPSVRFDPISVSTITAALPSCLGPADPAGNIYIGENSRVSRMGPTGTLTVIAGTGTAGYVDGPGATAQFSNIAGLALDAAGNLYVSDGGNNSIRKITPGGTVSTLAGNGSSGNQDGTGTAARFNGPQGIAVDVAGNVYVADTYNHSIRKITPAAVVTTIAGNGVPETQFSDPRDMAIDQAGNLYIQQLYGNLLKISPPGLVSSIYPPGFFGFKSGVTVDKMGNIYVSNFVSNNPNTIIIYKIFPGGDAAVLAGSVIGYKDTIGEYAKFSGLTLHLSIDDPGNIYVSDANGIRKLSKPKLNFAGNAGAPSPAKYFAISGNYLNGPANLQAPPGYELSLNEAGSYSAALTVGSAAGEILVRNIYIRLTASIPAGVYNDSVVLSANGAITQKLGVAGTVTNSPKKLVIIGSGTSACIGLNPVSECYTGRLSSAYNKTAPFDTTINNSLARGSTNCYNGMPSSYVSPYPASSGYVPVTDINITAALALNPDAVLVNYPTNGYDVLSVSEIMFCLRTIRDSANKKGVPCFITTTQPRTSPASFNTPVIKLKLAALKDSILAAFGTYAIDFWTGLINPADSSVLYDQGDHTNMNATGHNILFQRVLAKNVFSASVVTVGAGTGLQGAYYNNTTLTGPPVLTRIDPTVNNDFGSAPPSPGVSTDYYSIRWTGKVQPLFSETYTFYAITDDGVRLWVNGVRLIDNWVDQGAATEKSGTITLVAGQKYDIIMEYYKITGNGVAKLLWSSASTAKAIIPAALLYPPAPGEPTVPACAVNNTPVNGTTIATATSATLTWAPVANATDYYVYIWTGPTPPSFLTSSVGTSTYNATGLSPSTLYNWYVLPKNDVFTARGCGTTNMTNFTTAAATTGGTGTGLQGVYYNGIVLSGTPLLTRTDPTINFELTYAHQPLSPAPGIVPEDKYSVRWTGQVQPLFSESYTFYTLSDDGIRLWVNGVQLVDNWVNQGATEKSGTIALIAGQKYDIKIEYYENTGEAITKLYWSSASTPKAIIPQSQLYPAGAAGPPIPTCATNTSPANGTTIGTQTTATLTWGAVANATSYDVYIWTGATTPASPTANTTSATYNATGLLASTTYNWYVVPKNASGAATGCATSNKTSFTTAAATTGGGGTGLQGVYYNGIALSGAPLLTRIDPTINFELTYSHQPLSPAPGIVPEDKYSVRWTGQVQPLFSETYTFYTLSDDGIRLWVNGVQLVDNWVNQGATEKSGTIALIAGQKYDIKIEYYENTGEAITKLYWSSASTAKAIVPKSQLYPPASSARIMDNIAALQAMPSLETVSAFTSITAGISPNPVKRGQQTRLQINSNRTGKALITVMSSHGYRISSQAVNLVMGVNTTYVNTNTLAQGMYLISIASGNKPLTVKLIVD